MSNDAQADYEQIRTTWRFQEVVVKQSMLRELQDALHATNLDKSLTTGIVKLIDEIHTELRLDELQLPETD